MYSQGYNPLPGVESVNIMNNPMLVSPNSTYAIPFAQTRDSLTDVDNYRQFLKNVEMRVRKSVTYSHYKAFLMGLGMDHCQVHGYINSEMATIEMHHAIINLFDIALMITEHFLNTYGCVTTFDVVQTIKDEHKLNNIALVMLSKTPHQLYHSDGTFMIHPDMCIGNWPNLLTKYIDGLTQDVAFKLLYYIKRAIEMGCTNDCELLKIRDTIVNWSDKNVY